MYVAKKYQVYSAQEMDEFIARLNEIYPTWRDLLIVDYFYYNHTADYDGGLSFFDRINAKIGRFHPEWNIREFKELVQTADNKEKTYNQIIQLMFMDPMDIEYYGL
jgi:hypothetical protein